MDGATQVFQAPGDAVRVSSLQSVGGVQRCAHAAVIQHHKARLHAFAVPASSQGLVEAFEFKAALALTEDVSRHPVAPAGTSLLSSHSYEVHHVVDSAEKRGHLKRGGSDAVKATKLKYIYITSVLGGRTCSGLVVLRIS